MEEREKLKEFIRQEGITQTELAKTLGVSKKTVSFWLNGKSHPKARELKKIKILLETGTKETNGNEEKQKETEVIQKETEKKQLETKGNKEETAPYDVVQMKGILTEEKGGRKMDELEKTLPEHRKNYYNGKILAQTLEEKNNSRLILFPSLSSSNNDEWYKMGGKSALLYKYVVGPRLKRHVEIRKDTDLNFIFKNGVATVHFGQLFIDKVTKLGLDVERNEMGFIFVNLGRKYSVGELRDFAKLEKEEKEKVQKMIMPKYNFPDIYAQIRELVKTVSPKVIRMRPGYREVYGQEFLKINHVLMETYFRLANGHINKLTAKRKMVREIDDLTGVLVIVDELNLFGVVAREHIGEIIINLKQATIKHLGKEPEASDEAEAING